MVNDAPENSLMREVDTIKSCQDKMRQTLEQVSIFWNQINTYKLHLYEVQGVWTLSDKSNFEIMSRKIGQKCKVKVFSWSLMMRNLF